MKTQPKLTIGERIDDIACKVYKVDSSEPDVMRFAVGEAIEELISDLLDTLPTEGRSTEGISFLSAKYLDGWNVHVAEVRRWKEKIKKELK